jgi:hypothetical protein
VASPWVLGWATMGVGAWSADLLAGLALVALSAAALHAWEAPRAHDAPATTEGGQL